MIPPDPRDLGLPFSSYRPGQLQEIHWLSQNDFPYKVAVFPTGWGKSPTAIGAARASGLKRVHYLTTTRALQRQIRNDYPGVHIFWGQAGYPCLMDPTGLMSVRESLCRWENVCPRSQCLYDINREKVNTQPLTVMNNAVYLNDRRHVGKIDPPYLQICDEAHNLEDSLVAAFTIQITDWACQVVKLPRPGHSVAEAVAWAHKVADPIKAQIKSLQGKRLAIDLSKAEATLLSTYIQLNSMVDLLLNITDQHNWVVEDTHQGLTILPIFVRDLSHMMFGGAGRTILMSATIPNVSYLLDCLGIDPSITDVHTRESTFDPNDCPITILPIKGSLNYKTEQGDSQVRKELVKQVDSILDQCPDAKGLIHTGSYSRAEFIYAHSRHRQRMIEPTPKRREFLLREQTKPDASGVQTKWEAMDGPYMFLSPSVYEGVDFQGEHNRVQIICKVPFPSLGSPRIRARKDADKTFYPAAAILQTVQASGRAARFKGDRGYTFIIDGAINRMIESHGDLFPRWWHDRLVRA